MLLIFRLSAVLLATLGVQACKPGYGSLPGMPYCFECKSGYYGGGTGPCLPCPKGSTTADKGASSIADCITNGGGTDIGGQKPVAQKSDDVKSSYTGGGNVDKVKSVYAPREEKNGKEKSGGKYGRSDKGKKVYGGTASPPSPMEPCKKGYFRDNDPASECIPCPPGYTTAAEGAMSGSKCYPLNIDNDSGKGGKKDNNGGVYGKPSPSTKAPTYRTTRVYPTDPIPEETTTRRPETTTDNYAASSTMGATTEAAKARKTVTAIIGVLAAALFTILLVAIIFCCCCNRSECDGQQRILPRPVQGQRRQRGQIVPQKAGKKQRPQKPSKPEIEESVDESDSVDPEVSYESDGGENCGDVEYCTYLKKMPANKAKFIYVSCHPESGEMVEIPAEVNAGYVEDDIYKLDGDADRQ